MRQGKEISVAFVALTLALFLFYGLSPAQETGITSEEAKLQNTTAAEEESADLETNWLWGNVVSVDANAGQILLTYIDYEIDAEKNVTVYISPDTAYENVSGLIEIKPGNTVSLDYAAADDGKIIARHISVEQLEAVPENPQTSSSGPDLSNQTKVSE